jgi:hypothetical protein
LGRRWAVSSVTEQASDGGASDAELLGNGGFAQPFAGKISDFLCLRGDFGGPVVRTPFFAGFSITAFLATIMAAIAEAAPTREMLLRDANRRGEPPPSLTLAKLAIAAGACRLH